MGALSNFGGRAALLSTMDVIRDKVVKPKGDDLQQGLFATGELKKTESASVINMPDVDEFSDEELEALERQLLGFSLSAKPISEIISGLEFQSTHKINEILTSEERLDKVKVAAVVVGVRVITTKKSGAEMAFVKLDDGTGTIEVVVFPKVFKDTKDFWSDGRPLLILGKVDMRDETPGIIVDSIETVETTNNKHEEIDINIPAGTDLNTLKKLKTLLTESLGNREAYIVFEGGKKVKLQFKIYWDEILANKIKDILEVKSS